MYQKLNNYISQIEKKIPQIPDERKETLRAIASYVREKQKGEEIANLTFICTHNSRRSHLCQIWAAVMAYYYDVDKVGFFSGGTEATAFNPRAVAAIERAGFKVKNPGGDNPHYQVFFADEAEPLECFSKVYGDPINPGKNFAAIMTCSEADQDCPFIPGASLRVSLPYIDPKEADDTPVETKIYDERCKQIAAEMMYMVSQV